MPTAGMHGKAYSAQSNRTGLARSYIAKSATGGGERVIQRRAVTSRASVVCLHTL